MRWVLGYFGIGLLVGIWCAIELDPRWVAARSKGDLWLARLCAIPFYALLWPVEVWLLVRALVNGEEEP